MNGFISRGSVPTELQGVTVGSEVTELMARLKREGEFAEQPFTQGLRVQSTVAIVAHHPQADGTSAAASCPPGLAAG